MLYFHDPDSPSVAFTPQNYWHFLATESENERRIFKRFWAAKIKARGYPKLYEYATDVFEQPALAFVGPACKLKELLAPWWSPWLDSTVTFALLGP